MSKVEESTRTYNYLTCLISGFLFGIGLVISGMTLPEKVIRFLKLGKDWDPSLLFVMMGALLVSIPGFFWMNAYYPSPFLIKAIEKAKKIIKNNESKKSNESKTPMKISVIKKPLFDSEAHLPQIKIIDKNLISGAVIFGFGWALGGYCPGPGIVSATAGQKPAIIFTISMVIGMILHHFYKQWVDYQFPTENEKKSDKKD